MSRQTRPINEEDQRRSRSPQPDNRSHAESQRTRSPVIKQEKQASPNTQLLPTPDKTPQTSEFTPNSLNHTPASLNHIAPNQISHTSSQQRSFVAPFEQAPEQPLAIERFLAERNEMATMTMHAAQGHTPAAWDERGARARAGEFQTDAMTLPPIRQAVPELEYRPVSEAPRYRPDSVVPTIEGEGSSPTFYSPGERQRREERAYAQSQYPGAPVYAQQPMYRAGPYPEYSQSQYPEPQYDQRVPGYGRPQYAPQEYADPRARVMVQQPAYAPSYHPQEYRHAPHEVYQQHMGVPVQNGDGGKGGPQRKRRGNLPKETTDKLRAWFHSHLHHPYPTEDEKQELMMVTGLQMNQISNWFINARRRQLPQLLNDQKTGTPGKNGGSAPSAALSYAQKGDGRRYDDEDESEGTDDEDMDDYNDVRHSAKNNGKL